MESSSSTNSEDASLTWKYKLARIGGNAITGYFAGLGTISITDADLSTKLLNSLIGSIILVGILFGRTLSDYGDRRKGRSTT